MLHFSKNEKWHHIVWVRNRRLCNVAQLGTITFGCQIQLAALKFVRQTGMLSFEN